MYSVLSLVYKNFRRVKTKAICFPGSHLYSLTTFYSPLKYQSASHQFMEPILIKC